MWYDILVVSMLILNITRGNGRPRDYITEKGDFLVLGIVGIVSSKDGYDQLRCLKLSGISLS